MSERNHSAPAWWSTGSGKKTAVALGAAAVVVGSVLLYVTLRPLAANAQTEGRRRTAAQTAPAPRSRSSVQRVADVARRQPTVPRSGLVAKVNGQPITYAELVEALVRRHGEVVLGELINRRIIEQECAKRGISIAPAEIDAEIEASAQRAQMSREALLKIYEDDRGVNLETLVKDVIWPRLALKRLAGARTEVTEKELQESFEANFGERVKARMIMCNDSRRASEVWEKAKRAIDQGHPEEFARLVREYSTDPASRPLDGQIQPIHKYSGMPALEEAAFNLREGELSGVIQVGNYYVILLCEGRTTPSDVTMEEVRNDLYQDIYRKKVEQAALNLFGELKDASAIENLMTGESKDRVAAKPAPGRSPVQAASAKKPAPVRTAQQRRTRRAAPR
jgi:foldase protein PrsA